MMLQSARLTLKQHRFEVAAGAIAALLLGAAALWVNWKLVSLNVPPGCFDAWLRGGGAAGPECDGPVRAFGQINEEEAGKIFAAMAVLPFAVGLLGGVTLVGRELEARTAQTAWALAASRARWFFRQLWPILLVLGVSVTFAAVAASVLEATRTTFHSWVFSDLGLHGPLVVARAFAALGLGLLAGAALARTLPAFIVGAILAAALMYGAGMTRQAWVTTQPRVVVDAAVYNDPIGFDGLLFEQGWRTPGGTLLSETEATALAPVDGSTDPYEWLVDRGYEVVQFGVTTERLGGWEPLEIGGFALIGLALILGTVAIVDRRRPI
jgi:hypothetical protein